MITLLKTADRSVVEAMRHLFWCGIDEAAIARVFRTTDEEVRAALFGRVPA